MSSAVMPMQNQYEIPTAGSEAPLIHISGTVDVDTRPFQECVPRTEDPMIVAVWIAHTIAYVGRYNHASHFDTSEVDARSGPNVRRGRNKRKSKKGRAPGKIVTKDKPVVMDLDQPESTSVRKVGAKNPYQHADGRSQILSEIRSKLPIGSQHKFRSAGGYFEHKAARIPVDKRVADAGKDIAKVLFPIFNPSTDIEWKTAMTSFIKSMKKDGPGSPNFTMAFTILAQDKEILNGVEIIVEKTQSSESLLTAESDRVNGGSEFPDGKCRLIHSLNELGEKQSSIVSSDSFIYHGIGHLKKLSPQLQHSTLSSPYQNLPKNQTSLLFSSSSLHPISNSFPPYPPVSAAYLKPSSKSHRDTNKQPSIPTEMARTSGRIRKPTLRAMEADLSVLGKGKGKRPRMASPARKADNGAGALSTILEAKSRDQKGGKVKLASPCRLSEEIERAASQLLRLATEAMEPDFKPEVEVDLAELRRQFYARVETQPFPGDLAKLGRLADPSELDRPDLARPYTGEDGCVHTGRVNEHGEEFVKAPATFSWWRPEDVYNVNIPGLLPPPPRIRACRDIERDSVFGFPPPAGQPNLP